MTKVELDILIAYLPFFVSDESIKLIIIEFLLKSAATMDENVYGRVDYV